MTSRYGVLSGQIPVAGNILHHAIEMYLEGSLASSMTSKQLEEFRHNLPKVWTAFKVAFPTQDLNSFNNLISSLHAFEEIRYPESILAKGMAVSVGMTRLAGTGSITPNSVPRYEL